MWSLPFPVWDATSSTCIDWDRWDCHLNCLLLCRCGWLMEDRFHQVQQGITHIYKKGSPGISPIRQNRRWINAIRKSQFLFLFNRGSSWIFFRLVGFFPHLIKFRAWTRQLTHKEGLDGFWGAPSRWDPEIPNWISELLAADLHCLGRSGFSFRSSSIPRISLLGKRFHLLLSFVWHEAVGHSARGFDCFSFSSVTCRWSCLTPDTDGLVVLRKAYSRKN